MNSMTTLNRARFQTAAIRVALKSFDGVCEAWQEYTGIPLFNNDSARSHAVLMLVSELRDLVR